MLAADISNVLKHRINYARDVSWSYRNRSDQRVLNGFCTAMEMQMEILPHYYFSWIASFHNEFWKN
jgi:hypothetical protein